MLFSDYSETKRIYHIISIIDLDKTMRNGIKYDDKNTYKSKYYDFHDYIDQYRSGEIPHWVIRKKAIFGSLNFARDHKFHSHTVLLGVNIDPEKCWIANENLANQVYEPFILQGVAKYSDAQLYLKNEGSKLLAEYWKKSCSFNDNLENRWDKVKGYDAEVLIFHDIKPGDIEVLSIISDHRMMSDDEWIKHFCKVK